MGKKQKRVAGGMALVVVGLLLGTLESDLGYYTGLGLLIYAVVVLYRASKIVDE